MKRAWKTIALGSDGLLIEMQPGYACGKKDVVGGVVHLRMNNVTKEGAFNTTLLRRIPKDIAKKQGKFAEKGDVIFVNTNSTELVARASRFPVGANRVRLAITSRSCDRTRRSFIPFGCTSVFGSCGTTDISPPTASSSSGNPRSTRSSFGRLRFPSRRWRSSSGWWRASNR